MSVLCNLQQVEPFAVEDLLDEDVVRLRPSGQTVDLEELGIDEAEEVDLDRSWQLVHYLLTGCAEGGAKPLADAVMGGVEIDEETRYLGPEEVRKVAAALAELSLDEVKARFDPAVLEERQIYGGPWDDSEVGLVLVEELRDLYSLAAQEGKAMLISIG